MVARAVIWFDQQLFGPGDHYEDRAAQLKDLPRSELRRRMVDSMKQLSDATWLAARARVEELEQRGRPRTSAPPDLIIRLALDWWMPFAQ